MADKMYRSHLLPPQAWEVSFAAHAGLTLSMVRFAIAFFSSVPVAMLLRRIKSPTLRHWYALITGFILIYYPFGNGCLHALVTSSATYFLMVAFRQHCGTLTWLTAFPYLIGNHIAQASGMAWKLGQLDFTGAQMVLTLKLIAVAMCYQDGMRRDTSSQKEYAKAKRLDRLLTPLEFFSYMFASGNLLSGPFFEARDYLDFIEGRGDWADNAKNSNGTRRKAPNPLKQGAYRFVKALACAFVWLYGTRMGLTVVLLESPAWQIKMSLLARLVLLWATLVVYRSKYYFVWGVSESALIFSGMGFHGYDEKGRPRWDRYLNSRIRQVELNPSLADMPRHWNICTGLWLRHCEMKFFSGPDFPSHLFSKKIAVLLANLLIRTSINFNADVYERLTHRNRKPSFANMVITQLVSGVWHGVFAGYWMFFATSAFMFQASRLIYRYERTWSAAVRHNPLWTALKIVVSALILDYAGSAFMVLSLEESLAVWRACHYFGHVMIFGVFLVGAVMPPKRPRQNVEPESAVNAVRPTEQGDAAKEK